MPRPIVGIVSRAYNVLHKLRCCNYCCKSGVLVEFRAHISGGYCPKNHLQETMLLIGSKGRAFKFASDGGFKIAGAKVSRILFEKQNPVLNGFRTVLLDPLNHFFSNPLAPFTGSPQLHELVGMGRLLEATLQFLHLSASIHLPSNVTAHLPRRRMSR